MSEKLQAWLKPGSGPVVARLYHRVFALICLAAWLSLASQIVLLIGSDGLLPWNEYRAEHDLAFHAYPSLFFWGASNATLLAGTWIGVGLSCAAFLGIAPRVCAAANALLYLSYVSVCRWFLWFQWDSLLIECALLAVFLPTDRKSFWAHTVFRLLLFKLYFESGVAKLHSPIHDWLDGSAMTFYYDTAPLPTWMGWYAHQLPEAWHVFESWLVLIGEVFGALLILGGRRMRLVALAGFTAFQLVNLATANYGFFCHLALAMHLFLLDDTDLERAYGFLAARLPQAVRRLPTRVPMPSWRPALSPRFRRIAVGGLVGMWIGVSLVEGYARFGGYKGLDGVRRYYVRTRAINSYHLFASVTRDRLEPTFQTQAADGTWTTHHLRHKPGAPDRPPNFVAPHMPRVDFRLWFYGLRRSGTPGWVRNLVMRMCHNRAVVQPLFRSRLPERPRAVRIQLYRYNMTTISEKRATGRWWKRSFVRTAYITTCHPPPPPPRARG